MELLTQKQVYNEVGATSLSTNEIITKSEAQDIASQKLKRITNDLSSYSDSELIDEFRCESQTRVEYSIQVSYDNESWSDTAQAIFSAQAKSDSDAKRIYVKALKHTYLITGEKLSDDAVGCRILVDPEKFEYVSNTDGYSFWPKAENANNQFVVENIKVVNSEDETKECKINLIQAKADLELVHGDVIDFTYSWTKGQDLDQATTVACFINGVQDQYVGFGTNSRVSLPSGTNVLGFAGDNTGTGQEHALVDFDSIAQYINENRDGTATNGETIQEALTDENGLLTCKVYLYTVWYAVKGHDIGMSYTAYKKTDKDSFSWSNGENYMFYIYGVTESGSNTLEAYCDTYGQSNYNNPPQQMKLSATFTYYFNSGMFSIETNK